LRKQNPEQVYASEFTQHARLLRTRVVYDRVATDRPNELKGSVKARKLDL